MPTYRLKRDSGRYRTDDGRFVIQPAYEPSLRGGSVTRPSYWCWHDNLTGQHGTYRTLARLREALPYLYRQNKRVGTPISSKGCGR